MGKVPLSVRCFIHVSGKKPATRNCGEAFMMFRYLGYALLAVCIVSAIMFFTVAEGPMINTAKVTALMSGLVGVGVLVMHRIFA